MNVVDTLTLAEISRVEELAGQPISSFDDKSTPKGKALAALVFVCKRKMLVAEGLPTAQWRFEDAMNLTIEEANEILGIGTEEVEETAPLDESSD